MNEFDHNMNRGSRLQQARPALDIVESTDLLPAIDRNYRTGRRGHPNRIFLRTYLMAFLMGLPRDNDVLRLLDENPVARQICGLLVYPHRTSHKRFVNNLTKFQANIDAAIIELVNRLQSKLPDLGRVVAIDSTDVSNYKNPNRNGGDPTAKFGVKTSSKDKDGNVHTKPFYGFKFHLIADATHGVPLYHTVTPGNDSDSPTLKPMVEQLLESYDWISPKVLVGDRGYDSTDNFEFLRNLHIHPVIKSRDFTRGKLKYGKYDKDGVPYCQKGEEMWYLESDPERGYHYLCPKASDSHQCEVEHWASPMQDLKLFGTMCRVSPEWRTYYGMRYAIERIFKLMKGSHRLEHHTVSGINHMRVHVSVSLLVFLATILNNLQSGESGSLNQMVPKIP